MSPDDPYRRYQELQAYVGWTEDDAARVHAAAPLLRPVFPALVADFYAEIDRHPEARKVFTGGPAQVERLKGTLLRWLEELVSGPYDAEYVRRRWGVGRRHVEIGLNQVYTNVALSRLRSGLVHALQARRAADPEGVTAAVRSLNTLLDLDLALIEDAYQSEYAARQQRVERLAAIGQVAGGVAHELRNPLNVVKTSAYFLLNARNPSPEKKAEHLQRIEKHVALADNVITALSSFAKLPVPNRRPFPVGGCVERVLENNPLPAGCRVEVDCPPDLPAALGDVDQVAIVLGNLVRNAREAMPQGGQLTIAARADGAFVEIEVRDTGTGIPPDRLAHILEPLYSTKARGLGLGLAIARSILEKNDGSLRVASTPGQGSAFTVRLPADLAAEGGP